MDLVLRDQLSTIARDAGGCLILTCDPDSIETLAAGLVGISGHAI